MKHKILYRLKKVFKYLSGKSLKIEKVIECNFQWYGSSYGGFYTSPTNLNEESIVYSFGIGEDISFDKTVIEKHNCNVFAFDPTPKSIAWVNNQELPKKFKFYEFGISNESGSTFFYLQKNKEHVSGSIMYNNNLDKRDKIEVQVKSFNDIVKDLNHKTINVLKMDIEGTEYQVLPDILESGVYIEQLLIEFHHRFYKDGKRKTQNAIKLLKRYGFEIYAASDSSEEISFIRKEVLN